MCQQFLYKTGLELDNSMATTFWHSFSLNALHQVFFSFSTHCTDFLNPNNGSTFTTTEGISFFIILIDNLRPKFDNTICHTDFSSPQILKWSNLSISWNNFLFQENAIALHIFRSVLCEQSGGDFVYPSTELSRDTENKPRLLKSPLPYLLF